MSLFLKVSGKSEDIIVQSLGKELLIFDTASNRAVSLNETAAKVWQSLDGMRSVSDIASEYDFPIDLVLLAVEELQKRDLLKEKVETGLPQGRTSRRQMLIKATTAGIALPLIIGIVAPSAVHAQSGCVVPNGELPGFTFSIFSTAGNCPVRDCPTECNATASFTCCSGTGSGSCSSNGPTASTCFCGCS
jgi:hypothetical protein